ncbi:hypothetical protein GCM10027299_21610 [Larkinella ripae]
MPEPIVERLEEVRKTLRINKSEFARRIDSTQSYISKVLSGEKTVGPVVIDKVVKNLGVNRAWLETGDGEMFNHAVGEFDSIIASLGYTIPDSGGPFTDKYITFLNKRIAELEHDKGVLQNQNMVLINQLGKLQELLDRVLSDKESNKGSF